MRIAISPILFIVFNRPDTTYKVFQRIKEVEPPILYVSCDGPRNNVKEDFNNVRLTRSLIENIDWDCKVRKLYHDSNQGCKKAVSSAIDWFFTYENEGIIIEDDCLPSFSFFKYCSYLLEYHRDNSKIFSINGCNLGYQSDSAYFVSKYMNMWGWATWRRSAKLVDYNMEDWSKIRKKYNQISKLFKGEKFNLKWRLHWILLFNQINTIDTWDYQWIYTALKNEQVSIIPPKNLVKNLGFGEDATHTLDMGSPLASLSTFELDIPLKHPDFNEILTFDDSYEESYIKNIWEPVSWVGILKLIYRLFKVPRNIHRV